MVCDGSRLLTAGLLFDQRHPKMESRSAAGDVCGFDSSTMRDKDGVRDGQPHSRSFSPAHSALAAVELFKDERQIVRIDSGTIIFDIKLHAILAALAAERDA